MSLAHTMASGASGPARSVGHGGLGRGGVVEAVRLDGRAEPGARRRPRASRAAGRCRCSARRRRRASRGRRSSAGPARAGAARRARCPRAPSTSTQSCGSSSWPQGRPKAQNVVPLPVRWAGRWSSALVAVSTTASAPPVCTRSSMIATSAASSAGLGVEHHAQPVVLTRLREPVVERVEDQARRCRPAAARRVRRSRGRAGSRAGGRAARAGSRSRGSRPAPARGWPRRPGPGGAARWRRSGARRPRGPRPSRGWRARGVPSRSSSSRPVGWSGGEWWRAGLRPTTVFERSNV